MKLQRHTVFLCDFGKNGIYVQREKEDPQGRWVLSEDVKILEDLYAQLQKVCDAHEMAHIAALGPIEKKDVQ
jgi:hypothetical protein